MFHQKFSGIALGFAFTALAAPVAAQSINGSYDGYACQTEYRSQLALDIAWPEITFFESSCSITGSVAGAANTYTTSCSGEGEEWTGQIGLSPMAGGSLVVNLNGANTTYNRCGS